MPLSGRSWVIVGIKRIVCSYQYGNPCTPSMDHFIYLLIFVSLFCRGIPVVTTMASRTQQHLFSVQSQYIVRDENVFSSSSPRPEAEGKETDQEAGTTEGARHEGYRLPGAQPAFFDSKNRNSTDLAFRHRQNQKDVQFDPSPRHENKSPGKK